MRHPVLALVLAALALSAAACSEDGPADDYPGLAAAVEARWQQEFAGQDGRLWEALHPAQQDLIGRDNFQRCSSQLRQQSGSAGPVGVDLRITDAYTETVTVPGTDESTEAVAVTVELSHRGVTEQITHRMIDIGDGDWRWATSDPDQLANC